MSLYAAMRCPSCLDWIGWTRTRIALLDMWRATIMYWLPLRWAKKYFLLAPVLAIAVVLHAWEVEGGLQGIAAVASS